MGEGVFEELFHQVDVGLAVLDGAGQPLLLNRHCRELLGDDAEALICEAVSARLPEWEAGEVAVILPLGFAYVARVHRLAEGGHQRGYVLAVEAVGAGRDPLTGLESREALLDRLAHLLGRRGPVTVGVVVVDLDGFKQVNDAWGHVAGDEVLIAVADRLRSIIRPQDLVCRWGGDEFIVALEDPGAAGAEAVCRRVQDALRPAVRTSRGPVTVTASCGVVVGANGADPVDLLHRADKRMYDKKRERLEQPAGDAGALAQRCDRNVERSRELLDFAQAALERINAGRSALGRTPLASPPDAEGTGRQDRATGPE